ncbi:FMN-binding negative transcriptional regulator [Caulobacter segnis]|uniref:FMN-binding negative transcriptional regulator n=1 Tax=Caulobacter segnis TaxID=88688 RepID=UPI00240EA7A3|nr:FMN-binding negative transcriptional regulator [Caulobacter segnis]MDG2523016.1 FMN-binding negative transcriptional regulator [Caulobacter segnis]
MRPSPFVPARPTDVGDFVEQQILGLVMSSGEAAHVTPLPLLAVRNADGEVVEFFGHFGRSNPQIQALEADPRAVVVFMGPQAYISPSWISKPKWGPTWNYALAYFEVEIRFVPEENDKALADLADALEHGRWTPDRLEERYDELAPHILAFRARVVRQTAKFKLGQDETPTTFGEILDHLGKSSPLAELMRKTREPAVP